MPFSVLLLLIVKICYIIKIYCCLFLFFLLKVENSAVLSVLYCLAILLMMTAESMLSKRPVLRITVALFFLVMN